MRYDSEQKQQTHDRILREAAEAIRLDGPEKVGVAALMARAGLTHGGFYAHFKSKDALIAEAVTFMFNEIDERFEERLRSGQPAEAVSTYIDWYLSPRHRDRRDRGCPVVALSGDVVRQTAAIRKRFDSGSSRMIDSMAQALKKIGISNAPTIASTVVAEMVGAVLLARTLGNEERSNELLTNVRVSIKTRLGLPLGPSDTTGSVSHS